MDQLEIFASEAEIVTETHRRKRRKGLNGTVVSKDVIQNRQLIHYWKSEIHSLVYNPSSIVPTPNFRTESSANWRNVHRAWIENTANSFCNIFTSNLKRWKVC